METETVVVKRQVTSPKGKSTITGEGQFDKDGKMLIPVQMNGKMEMMSPAKVEKILKVTSKQLVDSKKNHSKRNVKAKIPKGKVGDPKFERANVKERDAWIGEVKKVFGLSVEQVKVNNQQFPTEPVLSYNGQRIVWASPRAGCLFGVYLFKKNGKDIVRVRDQKDIAKLTEWVGERVEEIDHEPKKAPKTKAKGSKKGAGKKAPIDEASMIAGLKERMKKCDKGHALKMPNGVLGNEPWFKSLCSKMKWTVDEANRTISRAKIGA